MVTILLILLIGLAVGLGVRAVLAGRPQAPGLRLSGLLGMGGAFIAAFLGQALGWYRAGAPAGWIAAVLGAVVMVLAFARARQA